MTQKTLCAPLLARVLARVQARKKAHPALRHLMIAPEAGNETKSVSVRVKMKMRLCELCCVVCQFTKSHWTIEFCEKKFREVPENQQPGGGRKRGKCTHNVARKLSLKFSKVGRAREPGALHKWGYYPEPGASSVPDFLAGIKTLHSAELKTLWGKGNDRGMVPGAGVQVKIGQTRRGSGTRQGQLGMIKFIHQLFNDFT